MPRTAKVFMNGSHQTVQIPPEFSFDCSEVFISQNPENGDVILSKKRSDWSTFLALDLQPEEIPADFMAQRDNDAYKDKDLF